jgi:hypothetical protein
LDRMLFQQRFIPSGPQGLYYGTPCASSAHVAAAIHNSH